MTSDEKSLLESLGYDVESQGGELFFCLLRDVRKMLNSDKTREEIEKELPKYYLEYYHFDFEIGKNVYFQRLNSFCNSRRVYYENLEANKEVLGLIPNMSLEDTLFFFAEYLNEEEKKNSLEDNNQYTLVKSTVN